MKKRTNHLLKLIKDKIVIFYNIYLKHSNNIKLLKSHFNYVKTV